MYTSLYNKIKLVEEIYTPSVSLRYELYAHISIKIYMTVAQNGGGKINYVWDRKYLHLV